MNTIPLTASLVVAIACTFFGVAGCSSADGGGSTDGGGTDGASVEGGSADGAASTGLFCDQSTDLCTCGVSSKKTTPGAVCDETSFHPATICCASPTYPHAESTTCQCMAWGCQDSGGSCSCSIASGGAGAVTECPADYTNCCVNPVNGLCICDRLAGLGCTSGFLKVAKCGLDKARCALSSTLRVKGCT